MLEFEWESRVSELLASWKINGVILYFVLPRVTCNIFMMRMRMGFGLIIFV